MSTHFGQDVEADLVERIRGSAGYVPELALVAETESSIVAAEKGETLVVLEGSPDYYGRLGFEPASKYGMRLPLPGWAPPEAAQLLPLHGFDPDDPTLNGHVV